jgi:plastocyanin
MKFCCMQTGDWGFGLALAMAVGLGVALGIGLDPARAAQAHKVAMADSQFGPRTLKAKVGDTLSFDNDDYENHWVYVPTFGHQISRAGMKPGDKWQVMLTKPGTFLVNCGLHAKMTATVTVEP